MLSRFGIFDLRSIATVHPSMALLKLEQVSKHFDGLTAVDELSFTVDRGEVADRIVLRQG